MRCLLLPAFALACLTTSACLGPDARTIDTASAPVDEAIAAPGIASTPVMGWNHWYAFRCGISESVVLAQANELKTTGLAASGYDLVALDDCWMSATRAPDGSLAWDPEKFPHGIPWLADQLHALGLRLGIYEAVGTTTCQRLPGSFGHYAQDARTFASWGIDFVKLDYCGFAPVPPLATLTADFEAFGAALRAANPAILYGEELPICCATGSAAFDRAVSASSTFANMWRVAADEKSTESAAFTITSHLEADLHLHAFARPGHWNDLDMVLTGNRVFGWTLAEEKSQLAVWAMEASPLLISADLRGLDAEEIAALRNPHLLAIDRSGRQAPRQIADGPVWAVMKPDPEGGTAVLLINTGSATAAGHFTPAELGFGSRATIASTDIWTGEAKVAAGLAYTLGPGETAFLQVE